MKIKIILLLLSILGLFSCEKDLMTYDFEKAEEQVYFDLNVKIGSTNSNDIDSTAISFVWDVVVKDDSIVKIPLKMIGGVQDFDRSVKISFFDRTNIQYLPAKRPDDYDLVTAVIPAGKPTGYVAIKLNNTAKLKDNIYSLGMRIESNEYFKTAYATQPAVQKKDSIISTLEYKINFSNQYIEPASWKGSRGMYDAYFGAYSEKKLRLITSLFDNLTIRSWDTVFSTSDAFYYAVNLKRYLLQQKQDGNTVYEEDGVTEMTAGRSV